MDNCKEAENNNNIAPLKNKDIGILKDGISNCALFVLIGFVIHLVIDNYISYGIIKGPIELLFNFYDILKEIWWIVILVLIGAAVQIYLCYLIEKLLALKILNETVGMALHKCNFFLEIIVITAISYIFKINPVILHMMTGHSAILFSKIISYIYVNKSCREEISKVHNTNGEKSEQSYDPNSKLIRYPQNVTISNAIEFFICTGSFSYNLEKVHRVPKNWKKVFQTICIGVLIHYVCGFIAYQYIIPELENANRFIKNFQVLHLIGVFFKLLFPVNVLWILHYQIWCFSYMLPLYTWIWGTRESVHYLDWWNAENTTIFWRKWNCQIHLLFQNYVFVPLKRRGYGKLKSSLAVALMSGILHEYFVSIPTRSSYGCATMGMFVQIPCAIISTYIHKNFGPHFGNLLMIFSILSGNTISLMTIYYNYTNCK